MEIDARVRRRYELVDEDARLWQPGHGELVRLRTWDIFDRLLPQPVRIADIGGGPGTNAAYLARSGHDFVLIDPLPHHVAAATARAGTQPQAPFQVEPGEALHLPLPDDSIDAALLMGPLYHLVERAERLAALQEVMRILRPGGRIIAEIITRYAWVMDATRKDLLASPDTWDDFEWLARTGQSKDPAKVDDTTFWAYFHRPQELATELAVAGFRDIQLLAVEGFAGLFDDLPRRMSDPTDLLRAIQLTESEPSMLGASGHVIGSARRR